MSNGWAPTLADHLAINASDGSCICFKCGDGYALRGGDDSGFCDPCAHEMIIRIDARLRGGWVLELFENLGPPALTSGERKHPNDFSTAVPTRKETP